MVLMFIHPKDDEMQYITRNMKTISNVILQQTWIIITDVGLTMHIIVPYGFFLSL